MSALGQKQTLAVVRLMSALPPIADMVQRDRDVRFVPIADIGCYSINRRRGCEMIDLLAVKPKPTKIGAASYEAAIDQLFKRIPSSTSALTQQAVSTPRGPVPNERRRR